MRREVKKVNGRVVSPESVPIHLQYFLTIISRRSQFSAIEFCCALQSCPVTVFIFLRCMGTPLSFSAMLSKGDSFHDFLFATLEDEPL